MTKVDFQLLNGRYARSIESGWLGRITSVRRHDGETMLTMVGVNELCRTIDGGTLEDWLDLDDIQYFALEDVKLVKVE